MGPPHPPATMLDSVSVEASSPLPPITKEGETTFGPVFEELTRGLSKIGDQIEFSLPDENGIGSGGGLGKEQEEEAEETAALLRDCLCLSVISIASSHAKTLRMTISEPVVACIADLAFKQTEQIGRDVELFAQHAGRKSVNAEDVILTAHRNEHLMGLLRDFAQELKGKEPCTERKRKKKSSKNENKVQEHIEMLD